MAWSAYNNNQPFQQLFQQPNYQQPSYQYNQYQQNQGIIKVSGIDGANAYQIPPNSSVPLFDTDQSILYIKSTDGLGFATVSEFTISPRQFTPVNSNEDIITGQDNSVLYQQYNELKEDLDNAKRNIQRLEQEFAANATAATVASAGAEPTNESNAANTVTKTVNTKQKSQPDNF